MAESLQFACGCPSCSSSTVPTCHLMLGLLSGDSSSQPEPGTRTKPASTAAVWALEGSVTSPPGVDHPHPRLKQPPLALSPELFPKTHPPSWQEGTLPPLPSEAGVTGTSVRIDADLAGCGSLRGSESAYSQETGLQRRCQVWLRHTLCDGSPAPADGREDVTWPRSAEAQHQSRAWPRERNMFLRFLMEGQNKQGSASRKPLVATQGQGSLMSFQGFNLTRGRCPRPCSTSSPGSRAQSQWGSSVLTSPSQWAEIHSCPVSKAPRCPLSTGDKAERDSGENRVQHESLT